LFEGKYARFSAKSKVVITASSIATAGASDYGVQSVIFGTLKAVADEMGIKLTHKQLSRGVPSIKTLRNWEIDLAGGCLAQVIEQIRKDAARMRKWGVKLEITLVTDHGN
jgi:hypothetical protein